MSTETDIAVAALLAGAGVTFSAIHKGARVKDKTKENPRGWECDAWSVAFQKGDGRESLEEFEYFTGTGHRKQVRQSPYKAGTIAHGNWLRANPDAFRAVAPQAADVLCCLLRDSSAVGQSFESWASEYGYDPDSRKAEGIYRACQQAADKLARVIPRDVLAQLGELLEDY